MIEALKVLVKGLKNGLACSMGATTFNPCTNMVNKFAKAGKSK